jgi:hypothetical protein
MGPIGCPETSADKYQSALRNIPEDRRFHLHFGGRPKSRTEHACYRYIPWCSFRTTYLLRCKLSELSL